MTRIQKPLGIVAMAMAMIVAFGAVSAPSAQASSTTVSPMLVPAPNQYYEVRSQLVPFRCLDVAHAGNGDGVAVVVANCWGGANQKWRFVDVGNEYYELHPLNSQRCLDVAGSGLDQGALGMQWACWGGAKQHWRLVDIPGGYLEIRNQLNQRCLDITGSGEEHAARTMIWDCWGGAKQRWYLVPVNP
ncbi:RICIN domain-containing protein [Micromonospora sp. NPDC047074]|uniref:RICIN domain-containing protein n=1 Tax=Micromonospora sp. NPDC047074 TaxID=3154339 RepID=UPI0033C31275